MPVKPVFDVWLGPERWVTLPRAIAGEMFTVINPQDRPLNVVCPDTEQEITLPAKCFGEFLGLGKDWHYTEHPIVSGNEVQAASEMEWALLHGDEIHVELGPDGKAS